MADRPQFMPLYMYQIRPEDRALYEIRNAGHDMGEGVFAAQAIAAGTEIMKEVPFYFTDMAMLEAGRSKKSEAAVKADVEQIAESSGRDAFMGGPNNFPAVFDATSQRYIDTPFFGRLQTSAIPLSMHMCDPRGDEIGVFRIMSKINHSCKANAQQTWNPDRRVETLYAIRDIKAGEEISISYSQGLSIHPERIRAVFGFYCRCKWCLFGYHNAVRDSEKNQSLLDTFIMAPPNSIGDYWGDNPKEMLKISFKILDIMNQEGIFDGRRAWILRNACIATIKDLKDHKRAILMASFAYEVFLRCEGVESYSIRLFCEALDKVHRVWKGATKQFLAKEYRNLMEKIDGQGAENGGHENRITGKDAAKSMEWLFMTDESYTDTI